MDEHDSSDHLNSSLTDLMTSLMVIFILLLLVFVHRTAGRNVAITDALLKTLRTDLIPQGFATKDIQIDKKDRNAILVIVPDNLMNFEIGQSNLKPEGEDFLRTRIPKLAEVICGAEYRDSVESVVVEGHTDAFPYRGHSSEESQNLNLKLSQDRSMQVVKSALSFLDDSPNERGCLLEKLSASGRGEQDLESTAEESRRVIFKIRVRADHAQEIEKRTER
jgi:flagellar motor protein MotB